jgi:hypothetical protein
MAKDDLRMLRRLKFGFPVSDMTNTNLPRR